MTGVTRSLFKYKKIYGGGICVSIASGQHIKKVENQRSGKKSRVKLEASDTCRLFAENIFYPVPCLSRRLT